MKKTISIIHWLPRIICILAILFISLFAADSFEGDESIWQKLLEFIIHLVPSFILVALLIIAWRWEFVGGIIFTLVGLATSPYIYLHNYNMNDSVGMSIGIVMMISFPLNWVKNSLMVRS